jgi:hypothetical protein
LGNTVLSTTNARVTVSSIPGGYGLLKCTFQLRTNYTAQTVVALELNLDTNSAHYTGNGGTGRLTVCYAANYAAGLFTEGTFLLPNYTDATNAAKRTSCILMRPDDSAEANGVVWTPTAAAAITDVTLRAVNGSFIAGSRLLVEGI